jgi:hypothetical protein
MSIRIFNDNIGLKMQTKKLPETFMGYSTKDLLKTWEEIQRPAGTQEIRRIIWDAGEKLTLQ